MRFFEHKTTTPIILLFAFVLLFTTLSSKSNAQHRELSPSQIADIVYPGINYIHKNLGVRFPVMRFNVEPGRAESSCGTIYGSAYCPRDHIFFVTTDHIREAYRYGDAALAYIIAHEYAHAMQNVFGIERRNSRNYELQADCLGVLYLHLLPGVSYDTSDMLEIGGLAHKVGDENTWSDQHHGNPQERMKAIATGIDASQLGLRRGADICISKYR